MRRRHQAYSLIECKDIYVQDCLARGQRPLTVKTKDNLLNIFLDWCKSKKISRLCQVDLETLESYRKAIYLYRIPNSGEPLALATQRMRLMAVTGMVKRLHNLEFFTSGSFKAFELPKVKKAKLLDIPSEEQIQLIFAQTDSCGLIGLRDRAILESCYGCGLRRAELAGLDIQDIDVPNMEVRVRKGKGQSDRIVPLADSTLATLKAYLFYVRPKLTVLESGDALFLGKTGHRIALSALSELVSRYIERSGIGLSGSCHVLRHAAATHMLRRGADIRYIQVFLGHEHIISTQIYTHVDNGDLRRVFHQTHPAAISSKKNFI